MTPKRGHSTRAVGRVVRTTCILVASAALMGAAAPPYSVHAGEIPTFAVDASWPKPLPNNWILGQVGGITVD